MKKALSLVLAVVLMLSMATIALADNTTTLTTTVPAATYTLNVPADQEIRFGATTARIGRLSVTESDNFAVGKNLKVTITYDAFKSENIVTTIPFALECPYGPQEYYTRNISSGSSVVFKGTGATTLEEYAYASAQGEEYSLGDMKVIIDATAWSKALAGKYTATITFTCEVVVEE